jgi:type II secretory pathway component PulF
MPKFNYRAKKGPSDIVEGTLEAPGRDAAVERLSQMGYLPILVEEAASAPPPPRPHRRLFSRVSVRMMLRFSVVSWRP